MNFLSHIPEHITSRTKCLIMLHGVGSNEGDLFVLKEKFGNDLIVISLRGPFILGQDRFAWYPVDFSSGKPVYKTQDLETGYREIISCIDEVRSKYDISPENIFLLGFSQGAIMAYYTLWRSPEKIGGIIALSGRLLDEIDTDTVDENDYREKRIFIGHGVDDTVIPVTATGPTSLFVRKLGIEPTVKFYPIGHTISPELDRVIPEGVNGIIIQSAPLAVHKERIIISDAPHMVGKWMNENPERIQDFLHKLQLL